VHLDFALVVVSFFVVVCFFVVVGFAVVVSFLVVVSFRVVGACVVAVLRVVVSFRVVDSAFFELTVVVSEVVSSASVVRHMVVIPSIEPINIPNKNLIILLTPLWIRQLC